MQKQLRHPKRWLLPAVLILFVCQVIAFPFAVGITYAGRSESPNHMLTYTTNKLVWDNATGVDAQGVAELSLFDSVYQNVEAGNGDKVVAPGTGGMNILRLKNSVSGRIGYTAVLYKISGNEQLPVEASLKNTSFADTTDYSLPEGVDKAYVLRAVEGTLGGGEIQDFDINWLWTFEDNEERDRVDTLLGNKAALDDADDVTVGLYIVVRDQNEIITPKPPQTGDNSMIGVYLALMCISGTALILLTIGRRRENREKCEKS